MLILIFYFILLYFILFHLLLFILFFIYLFVYYYYYYYEEKKIGQFKSIYYLIVTLFSECPSFFVMNYMYAFSEVILVLKY